MEANTNIGELLHRWRNRDRVQFQDSARCSAIALRDFADTNALYYHAKVDGIDTSYLGNYIVDDGDKVYALFGVKEHRFALLIR